jgi:hypothetical protein
VLYTELPGVNRHENGVALPGGEGTCVPHLEKA